MSQILLSSESNEWYTPSPIIQKAREVMGGIDLDPASCDMAQTWIQATRYYTQRDDGLTLPWNGRVWVNPPYGQANAKKGIYGASRWIHKAIDGWQLGEISACILLVRGDSSGIARLEEIAIECSPRNRIAFVNPGSQKNSPVPGSKIFYLGSDPDRFARVFSDTGAIRVPYFWK